MERIEFKFATEGLDAKTGTFSGYGAVFGNVDSHGDMIEPGAFKQTLAEWSARGSLPIMKMMHGTGVNPFSGSDLPIGKWAAMSEDSKGLHVEGKLSGLNTDRGKYHFALMEDGALNGLSIGYKARKSVSGNGGEVKRRLQDVRLAEVSLVPEGSNDLAVVAEIKAILGRGGTLTVRHIEDILRDADVPKALAGAIASKAKPLLDRGEPEEADELAEYLMALRA